MNAQAEEVSAELVWNYSTMWRVVDGITRMQTNCYSKAITYIKTHRHDTDDEHTQHSSQPHHNPQSEPCIAYY